MAYTACNWFSKAFGDAGVISDAILHGDRIAYRYERRSSNTVDFFQLLLENGKKRTF